MLIESCSEKEDSVYKFVSKEYSDLKDEDRVVIKRSDRAKCGSFLYVRLDHNYGLREKSRREQVNGNTR